VETTAAADGAVLHTQRCSRQSIHRMKDAVETMISFVGSQSTGLTLPVWVPTA
jgi:hypothetical protein